jgi:hypothetical protein
MKTLLRRRRDQVSSPQPRLGLGGDLAGSPSPSRDHSDGELTPADKTALGARATTISSGVHSMTTRAVTLALAGAIACGPAAIIWRTLTPPPQPVTAAATTGFDQRMTSRRAVASETAAAWVQAWLTTPAASADRLTAFYAGKVELPDRRGRGRGRAGGRRRRGRPGSVVRGGHRHRHCGQGHRDATVLPGPGRGLGRPGTRPIRGHGDPCHRARAREIGRGQHRHLPRHRAPRLSPGCVR